MYALLSTGDVSSAKKHHSKVDSFGPKKNCPYCQLDYPRINGEQLTSDYDEFHSHFGESRHLLPRTPPSKTFPGR